eukprot:336624-Rhodomonas_salina.3
MSTKAYARSVPAVQCRTKTPGSSGRSLVAPYARSVLHSVVPNSVAPCTRAVPHRASYTSVAPYARSVPHIVHGSIVIDLSTGHHTAQRRSVPDCSNTRYAGTGHRIARA